MLMKELFSGFRGKPLDKKQIAAGTHLCFMNARSLSDEARLLRKNGNNARALSLIILALEELGKIPLIVNTMLYKRNDAKAWRDFWKVFQSHRIKLGVWTIYGKQILHLLGKNYETELPSGIEALADKFKQIGFYVTFFEDQFIFPEKFTKDNRDWLDFFLAILDERITSFDPLYGTFENSEKFIDRGIEFLATVKGAKTEDEMKKIVTLWISQHRQQEHS